MKIIFTLLLLLGSLVAHAQYSEYLKPVPEAELARMRKGAVKVQEQFEVKNDAQVLVRTRTYDKSGRLLSEVTPGRKLYFNYTPKGQLASVTDSSGPMKPYKKEIKFKFDSASGMLDEVKGDIGRSSFGYNPSSRKLEEWYTDPMNYQYIRVYYYDQDGRLSYSRFLNYEAQETNWHRVNYGGDGKMSNEKFVQVNEDRSRDTITHAYNYNDKGQMTSQHIVRVRYVTEFESGRTTATESSQHIIYGYDAKGNLIEEQSKGDRPEDNYKVMVEYNPKDLNVKETWVDDTGSVFKTYTYTYKYF